MKHGLLALSGFNMRALIAVCRFVKSRGQKVHLLATSDSDPVLMTDYSSWVFETRTSRNLILEDFIEYIKNLKSQFGYTKVVLLPTTEYFNRFILENRMELEKAGGIIPLTDESTYTLVSDKLQFSTLVSDYGLGVPKQVSYDSICYPFVAKPKSYHLSGLKRTKPYLIFNAKERSDFELEANLQDYYFQEFVEGESHYLLMYVSTESSVCFSQQNLIQQADGRSIIAAVPTELYQEQICKQYVAMFKSIGFKGLVMVELRKSNDSYFMIEANPRFWGPFQLVVDSCPAILEAFFREQGLDELAVPARPKEGCFYFWSGGLVSDQKSDKESKLISIDKDWFEKNLQEFKKFDVFAKEDTTQLYMKEERGEDIL